MSFGHRAQPSDQDIQGHEQGSILSTDEVLLHQPEEEKQREQMSKKKSRGNRRLQRFRAKLRKQGLTTEAIAAVINEYNHPSRPGDESEVPAPVALVSDMSVEDFAELSDQELQDGYEALQEMMTAKRKRESRSVGVTTSISQMSIVQPSTKRPRATTVANTIQSKDENKAKANMKPNYLHTPDNVFREMLSTASQGAEIIVQELYTQEKLQYARHYTELVNNVSYLTLKQDFWENYYKIATSTGIWSLQMSKQLIRENNLHPHPFRTQNNVEKQRQFVIDELKKAIDTLNEHKQLSVADQSIDIDHLSSIIHAFVHKSQHRLRNDFERKKLLLQLDAHEYHLVQTFYQLQPTEDQIGSAKIIWQAAKDREQSEEYVAILKQRIYTKRLPSSLNHLDHPIDMIEKLLTQPALHVDKRATLSSEHRKMITRFKYDTMQLTIRTAEEIIRSHANIIANEKKKIIDTTAHGKVPLPKALVSVLNAIAARQSNITKRAQIVAQHQMSFFDHAPTVMGEEEEAGATVGAIF